jgi:hypothetical protein
MSDAEPSLSFSVDDALPPAPAAPVEPASNVDPPPPPIAVWLRVSRPVVEPFTAFVRLADAPAPPLAPKSPNPPEPPLAEAETLTGPVSELPVAVAVAVPPEFDRKGVGLDPLAAPSVNDRFLRNLRLQPKTAFSRFPPVHKVDLEGQQRVGSRKSN